jgi:DNA (cytosine-5)-methyltransferase 1
MIYYNEFDPHAAAWLRNLCHANIIPPGDIDTRSIVEVSADDVKNYTQCHFFAGIGGWCHALHLAEWSVERPVWTGSCPCQPFSASGKGGAFDDPRHLWPFWYRLIDECRPPVVFGEQVASKDGLLWLDLVSTDMERSNYAFAANDLCAASVGAPHIRQRLWFVGLDNGIGPRLEGHGGYVHSRDEPRRIDPSTPRPATAPGTVDRLADTYSTGSQSRRKTTETARHGHSLDADGRINTTDALDGFWRDADWLGCRDGKFRSVEPGTFPLAHGIPGRVGRLRAYGNAIVPQVAAEFIKVVMEYRP